MKNEKEIYYKNRGVPRNKTPLNNIQYRINVFPLSKSVPEEMIPLYDKFKFKDLGYLSMDWTKFKANKNGQFSWFWHGMVTPEYVKELLGEKQWSKFCQGKREFTVQRRIDGKNIQKKLKINTEE